MTSSYSSAFLILLGMFLTGGVISLFRQGVSKGIVVVMGLCAVMALASGLMRWS